jgi:hypothetical protein
MAPMKSYICGCVRNCKSFLVNVFKNIEKIITLLDDYHIVIAFDESNDNSLEVLYDIKARFNGKMTILLNNESASNLHVKNICMARNRLLDFMQQDATNVGFDYFIMMDMDDVCASPIRLDILNGFLQKERRKEDGGWDVLTFFKKPYYDIWALSVSPYCFSCWNFPNGKKAVTQIQNFLHESMDKLSSDELLPVKSAFNGFAIYRRESVVNCHYEWNIHNNVRLLGDDSIMETRNALRQPVIRSNWDQDCEHRFFHLSASQQNGARIMISPKVVFA